MSTVKDLIGAYEERLSSYQFLLKKVELELASSTDSSFIDFCECEGKRLQDLIQLCQQVLIDLNRLTQTQPLEVAQTRALQAPDTPKKK